MDTGAFGRNLDGALFTDARLMIIGNGFNVFIMRYHFPPLLYRSSHIYSQNVSYKQLLYRLVHNFLSL